MKDKYFYEFSWKKYRFRYVWKQLRLINELRKQRRWNEVGRILGIYRYALFVVMALVAFPGVWIISGI